MGSNRRSCNYFVEERERERKRKREREKAGGAGRRGREEKRTQRSFILSGSDGDIDRCNATSQTVPPPLQHLAIFFASPFHDLLHLHPPNYPANDLYERDYRTPWKSITLYQFFLKGFAITVATADSIEILRGILLSKEAVELLFARPRGCYLLEYFSMLWFSRSLRRHRSAFPSHRSALCDTINRFFSRK